MVAPLPGEIALFDLQDIGHIGGSFIASECHERVYGKPSIVPESWRTSRASGCQPSAFSRQPENDEKTTTSG
jgi:hypothetical protein